MANNTELSKINPKNFKKAVNKLEEEVKTRVNDYLKSDHIDEFEGNVIPGFEDIREAHHNALEQRLTDVLNNRPVFDDTTATTIDELRNSQIYNDGDQSKIRDGREAQKMQSLWSTRRNWDPNNENLFSDFNMACIKGQYDIIKRMLDSVRDNQIEKFKLLEKRETQMRFNSLLNLVAGARSCPPDLINRREPSYMISLDMLIQNGVNINAKDFAGHTAFMLCCSSYYNDITFKMAEVLLKAGSNINEQNRIGASILFDPAMAGNFELCKWLVDNGADPNIREYVKDTSPVHVSCLYPSILSLFSSKITKEKRAQGLVCANCGKPSKNHCAKCIKTQYCSKECKKADWPKHKKICASLLMSSASVEDRQVSTITSAVDQLDINTNGGPIIARLKQDQWKNPTIACTSFNFKTENLYSNTEIGNQESKKTQKKKTIKSVSNGEDSNDKLNKLEDKRFALKVQIGLSGQNLAPMMCHNKDHTVRFAYLSEFDKYKEIHDKVAKDGVSNVKAFFGAWIDEDTDELFIDGSDVLVPKTW